MRELTGKPVGLKTAIGGWQFINELCDAVNRRGLEYAPDFIAIDGKTSRRTHDRRKGLKALHTLSAYATNARLCLAQISVPEKANEITAIPELLDTQHLDGAIVTLDAMGCQKDIAARIRAKGADYLLALKANHGRAFEAVRGHFERTCFCRGASGRPAYDAFDDSHGRLARRRVFVSPVGGELEPLHEWPDLRTLLERLPIRLRNRRC